MQLSDVPAGLLAGVDEAGRGPLAGPVIAAAVILDPDNPVEVDFSPEGEMLGTANLFYRKRGDTLVHWMHGGAYPRYDQQQCIDEFISTGDPLTEVHNLGHVAISGITRYRGTGFGI